MPLGETTSTLGPRRMPRRSAAMAPFGGGSLASSSVINCVACAASELKRPAATSTSNVFRIILTERTLPSHASLSLTHPAIADDRVWRPEQRMRIGKLGLALAIEIARPVNQSHHRLA